MFLFLSLEKSISSFPLLPATPQETGGADAADSSEADADEESDDEEDLEDKEEDEEESENEESKEGKSSTDKVNDIAGGVQRMTFSNGMKPNYGYLMYDWLDEENQRRLTIDFLVPSLNTDMFRLRVLRGGKALHLRTVIPLSFLKPSRLTKASGWNVSRGSSKAVAFTEAATKVADTLENDDGVILSEPQCVKLPFAVEEHFREQDETGWEVLALSNPNKKLKGDGQKYFVVTVELVDVNKPRPPIKKASKKGVRVVDCSSSEDEEDVEEPFFRRRQNDNEENEGRDRDMEDIY